MQKLKKVIFINKCKIKNASTNTCSRYTVFRGRNYNLVSTGNITNTVLISNEENKFIDHLFINAVTDQKNIITN